MRPIGVGYGLFSVYVDDEISYAFLPELSRSVLLLLHVEDMMQLLPIRVLVFLPNSQGATVTGKVDNEQQQGFGERESEHGSSEDASEMLPSRDSGGGAGEAVGGFTYPCVQQGPPHEKNIAECGASCASPKFQNTCRVYTIM